MKNYEQRNRYQIELVNLPDAKQEKAKVMICQLDFDQMAYDQGSKLCFVSNTQKNRDYIRNYLNIAIRQRVDLLVFPELVIPSEFVEELVMVSAQYDMYIVGGTHYKQVEDGFLSICPIVTPHGVFSTEKITPSPYEVSSFKNRSDGAINGKRIYRLQGTKIGDLAVAICMDYTDDALRVALGKDDLDFLVVTAFNSKTDEFACTMQSDVQRSSDGLYLIYCNTLSKKKGGEGRSSLYAFVDDCFKKEFKENGCTDLNPNNKMYDFSENKTYCIFEVDLVHKKPYKSKNGYTIPNVRVIEEDDAQVDERNKFIEAIGATEDIYKLIDHFYVKPQEYDEMMELLERENVLVITGDPGIGKTYTAIHFLLEYYKKGFRPTWFYGLGKEDRDIQKKKLHDFEPQKKDVVYIEDPFGRTVFENREELKTLFSNLVEKFRAYKAKLIITSRSEVFKQFEREVVSGDKLEAFKKELNVRNPSYRKENLREIAKRYIEAYTSWAHNKKLSGIIYDGIESELLISPFMIYNMVRNHSQVVDAAMLRKDVAEARKSDLITQFADEIKMVSHPGKILLYLVLFYGKKNIKLVREMFEKVQLALLEKTRFEGSAFSYELKGQEDHRIQRLGAQIPVYRFSHPTYEEALIELIQKDPTSALVSETCLTEIVNKDSWMAVDIFKRFVMRYPKYLEEWMKDVITQGFRDYSDADKLELTRKMLLSDYPVFQEMAKGLYPIETVLKELYEKENDRLLELRLRMLNRRKEELANTTVDWARIFSNKRISGLHPAAFLTCYALAYAVDDSLILTIEDNFQKTDIVRKFILLPTEKQREEFNKILSDTCYCDVYEDLKNKIPEDIMGERVNKRKYVSILRKYILKKEDPKGEVHLDDGAMRAVKRTAKIYPIGVTKVVGDFENGDIVYLVNERFNQKVLSMTELSSQEIRKYKGLHSPEIYDVEGELVSTVVSGPYYRDIKSKRYK